MLYPTDADLARAVESQNQRLGVKLLFDWNKDGLFNHAYSDLSDMVVSADLDKSLTGALPPNTPFVEGASASELKLVLAGRRKHGEQPANVVFSKYNPNSPLYNKAIRGVEVRYSILVDTDKGPVEVRQFTGRIRMSSVSAEHGEVEISCLDAVEDLKRPMWLPAYGDLHGTNPAQMFSSHWVMDRVLRENGFYQSWPTHPDACYAATLHGGTAPEVGLASASSFYNASKADNWVGGGSEPMYFDPKGYELTTAGNTAGNRIPRPDEGNTIGLAFRFKRAGTNTALVVQYLNGKPLGIEIPSTYEKSQNCAIDMKLTDTGSVYINLQNYYGTNTYDKTLTSAVTISDTNWHTAQGECTFNSSSVTFRIKVDNNAWEESTLAGAYPAYHGTAPYPPYPYIEWPLWFQVQTYTPVTNVVCYANTTPKVDAFPSTFVSNARLDAGINRLSAVPEFLNTASWDILTSLAQTEMGSVFVDEYGKVQFYNMNTSRTARTTEDRKIGADKISAITITDATDSVVNTVYGTVKPYCIGLTSVFDAAESTKLYDNSNPRKQVTLEYTDHLTATNGSGPRILLYPEVRGMLWPHTIGRNTVPYYGPSTWDAPETVDHGLCAIKKSDGTAPTYNPTIDVWLDKQNTLYLAVFNLDNTYPVQLANKTIDKGNPPGSFSGGKTRRYCLKIGGVALLEQPEIEYQRTNDQSILDDGYQPYEIESNEWTQSFDAMTKIADTLLSDMSKSAIPLIDDIAAPGDPRIQLGDTLKITDAGSLGGSLLVIVTGITRSLSADGFQDKYALKLVHQPASWLLGDPIYSVLGETTIIKN